MLKASEVRGNVRAEARRLFQIIRRLTFPVAGSFAPTRGCDCSDCTRMRSIRKLAGVGQSMRFLGGPGVKPLPPRKPRKKTR